MNKKTSSVFCLLSSVFCLLSSVFCLLSSVFPVYAFNPTFERTSLSGKITDKKTGETLPGVTVYIPDLKTGVVSNIDGTYQINNLPQRKMLIQISYIGYRTIIETIDLSTITTKDFSLEESIKEIKEVVITGTSKATEIKRSPIPIVAIDKKHLEQNLNTNIIDAIAKLPGVNAVTTGPNVSKPFIRGLGFNRILTLYDGVRQEGQQWGDEHGIEVDEYSVDKVEVVKGPASLIYGSDALAGVVNLLPEKPMPVGTIKGSVLADYQTNNRLYGLSASIAGNNNGLIWGGRVSRKQATNFQNKIDGRVYGTSFREMNGNVYLGLNRHWGYSHLKLSAYDDLQSIPTGSRDSATRKFTKQITEADTLRPIVSDEELNSYTMPTLHQHIQYYRIISSNDFMLGDGKLGVTLSYQQSIRREFSHPEYTDVAGLYLLLQSYTYDVKYHLPELKGWETTIGINGMEQTNENKGTEFIIPNYNLFDIGPFAFLKKSFSKLDFSAGVRYDNRFFKNDAMFVATNSQTGLDRMVNVPDTVGATQPFQDYKHTFSGMSGSMGATYNFSDDFLVKANIARGFRAPNIAEISANGVHPGTNIYQLGNANFKPELSLQEDIGITLSTKHITANVEIFNNNISNYIYNEKVLNGKGQDSVIISGTQTFQFQAARVQLYGGEATLDIHPHPWDWLHFENSISVLYAYNKGVVGIPLSDSAKYLPFIPPFHTRSELRANIKGRRNPSNTDSYRGVSLTQATDSALATSLPLGKGWGWANLYVKVEMEYYAQQDRVYLAFNTETATPAYTLFNAGAGADVTSSSGKVLFSIHLSANNITDVAYQAHLSRLKYFESYSSSPNGHLGIYNMGRNLSFKITVPLG